jgi:uncharacterized protein Yka (UPF0111/DUF47 family)
VKRVGSTFITPFDREDLFELLKRTQDLREMAAFMCQAIHLIKDPEEPVKNLVGANRHYSSVRYNYVAFLKVSFESAIDLLSFMQAKVPAQHIEGIAAA